MNLPALRPPIPKRPKIGAHVRVLVNCGTGGGGQHEREDGIVLRHVGTDAFEVALPSGRGLYYPEGLTHGE